MPVQCAACKTQFEGKFCPACGSPAQAHVTAGGTVAIQASATPAAPAGDPLLGQTLGGKYKVVKVLGEGGMGCVYKGEQQLGPKTRPVAIKTLHPHLSNDAKILARFEREVGTVAELEHPNTINVHDFGKTEGGVLYIVMEFVQGQNLADTLEKGGAMEPARVEKIMSQICGSLEEAHAHGIVHRDLKPDNIVLCERAGSKDFVKVLDFGIAKRANEEDKNEQKLTQQGMVLGTPPYMSPEQFTGKPIGARSDIYSLAIVAYEMLTANLPFAANTSWEWATQHMTVPPKDIDTMPFHERIPARMKDALRRALKKAPEERFANVHEFFEAFSAGQAMAPVAAGATAPPDLTGAVKPAAPAYVPAPQAGTPALGNVAFPTPHAGIPEQSHEEPAGGGGKRGMLFGIAGVVGVLSVGAIAFALRGGAAGKGEPLPAPTAVDAPAAPAVNLDPGATPEPAPSAARPADSSTGTGSPPPHASHPGKEPAPKGSAAPKPAAAPPGAPSTATLKACSDASKAQKAGNVAGYDADKKKCEAGGGTVPP